MEIKYWSPGEQEKTVTRTHGYWVEYSNGETHIDIQCGNMAYILGYGRQEIVDAVAENTVNFIRGNTGESSQMRPINYHLVIYTLPMQVKHPL
jgi:adenosylmethionine-8-amino-7-oxononanoate aminotransferase